MIEKKHTTHASIDRRGRLAGDVQPYVALGLREAGFQVQICADRLFEQLVASSGLAFTPVTAAPINMLQQNISRYGGPFMLVAWLKRHFQPLARQFFADLEQATRQSDAILSLAT